MRFAALGWLMLIALGCSHTLYPVTNGSYRMLPPEGTPVVIWGDQHDAALVGAENWLERRGLVIMPRATVREAGDISPAETPADEKPVISAAAALGAKVVVFVQSGAIPPFPASVSIRGVAVPTGEQLWEAKAWYTTRASEPVDLESLACQALATVWGFRPAGYHEIPSSNMCMFHESRPKGHPTGRYEGLG